MFSFKKSIRIAAYGIIMLALYIAAIYRYAPSDVTMGLWLGKPHVVTTLVIMFALLLFRRLMTVLFCSNDGEVLKRTLISIFFLPSYAVFALLFAVDLNGVLDDKLTMMRWPTNIVYHKDLKLACVVGAVDDAQLAAQVKQADIIFVPLRACRSLGAVANYADGGKHPVTMVFSNGFLGIPYIHEILQAPAT